MPTTRAHPRPEHPLATALAQRRHDGHTGYLRDHAHALGTSELTLLLATRPELPAATAVDWGRLFAALRDAGTLKTMTRNESVVLERTGRIEALHIDETHLQVVGADIDLRGFPGRWHAALAVADETPRGQRRSVQLFDRCGDSVFKAYLDERAADHETTWATLCTLLATARHVGPDDPLDARRPVDTRVPAALDVPAFHAAWDALTDTHDFHRLLARVGIGRRAAMDVAGGARATRLAATTLESLLLAARERAQPLMLFVGNAGMIQIHHGVPRRLSDSGGWFNVLDPGMNLHVRREQLESAWIVRKPTAHGMVSAVEFFDDRGEQVLLVHAERRDTTPGDAPAWSAILAALPRA
ncbi:MAG: hypothetical protein MUE41_06270 [Gemmatimonadaceae bacterium]|jgi:putative hemin transport protein|nr:hypothetical protein [Gemmatimonadaceae bacterium]